MIGYKLIITRLFSILWNAPFTCMGLPDFWWLFFNNDVAMHIMTTAKESHVSRITPQVLR